VATVFRSTLISFLSQNERVSDQRADASRGASSSAEKRRREATDAKEFDADSVKTLPIHSGSKLVHFGIK
jgi:hypothetical protein